MFYLLSLSKKEASKWILLHWSFVEAYTDLLGIVTACKSCFLLRPMSLSEEWQKFSLLVHPPEKTLRDNSDRLREESFNGHFYLYTLVIYYIKNLSSFSLFMDVYIWVYPATWLRSYCQVLLKSMHWSVHAIALQNWAKCWHTRRPMWKTSTIIKTM